MPRTPDGKEYFTPQQLARIRNQEAVVRDRIAAEEAMAKDRARHANDRAILNPQTLQQFAKGVNNFNRGRAVDQGMGDQRRGLSQSAYPQRRPDDPRSAAANAKDRRDQELLRKLESTKPKGNKGFRLPKFW